LGFVVFGFFDLDFFAAMMGHHAFLRGCVNADA
jgi:hypothetical protein